MFKTKFIITVLFIVLADFLFYRQEIGWTLALYNALLFIALITINRAILRFKENKIISILIIGLIASLIESPQLLNIGLTGLALASLLIIQKQQTMPNTLIYLKDVILFLNCIWRQSYHDIQKLQKINKRKTIKTLPLRYAVLPLTMAFAFIWLFSLANPIIAQTLNKIDWDLLLRLISPMRWIFWIAIGMVIWALFRPRFKPSINISKPNYYVLNDAGITVYIDDTTNLNRWFNAQTLLWSLILFNAIFAIQNSLDILFLWSDQTLPNGLTYAEYAHAGFYPLFAISLITAAYVLLIFNEQQNNAAKYWVFLWLGQTVFLLCSAIWRLNKYVEVYSLTHLRIAAFTGMLLTAIGLILILIKIHNNRNNSWLINSNALAVMLSLYSLCFINLNEIIADYNVRHCIEVTGMGNNIDLTYLEQLGTDTLPALRWFEANAKYSSELTKQSSLIIQSLENKLSLDNNNWRTWTWRNHRIIKSNKPITTQAIKESVWQY
ncbi:hypothetical protein DOJK_02469 [Patescibacteria group bacterium]|nr:hypothetical protein DOJK_02469 [Patescibacteria group bacterium]